MTVGQVGITQAEFEPLKGRCLGRPWPQPWQLMKQTAGGTLGRPTQTSHCAHSCDWCMPIPADMTVGGPFRSQFAWKSLFAPVLVFC